MFIGNETFKELDMREREMINKVLLILAIILIGGCSFIKIEVGKQKKLELPNELPTDYSVSYIFNPLADTTYGEITGTIFDNEKKSVSFISVFLANFGSGAQTDEDGNYKIEKITPGIYNVLVKGMGYEFIQMKEVEVKKGMTTIIEPVYIDKNNTQIDKPMIYLYPKTTIDVQISLQYDGEIISSYPRYNNGWIVKANPDGTLMDEAGKEYYALFWEGKPNKDFIINEGFVIPGSKVLEFLEKTLPELGLNPREANEFIVYWLPKMEQKPYNLIHFSTLEYEKMAKLNITPEPDEIIRIMMVVKNLEKNISVKKQNLEKLRKERTGFTVVEWGGCLLP
jgi:hypothetical protein